MTKVSGLHVEIISPSGVVFDGNCHMATIPGANGEFGIMNNHEPILTHLTQGVIKLFDEKEKVINDFEVTGGFAHNVKEKLLVLID